MLWSREKRLGLKIEPIYLPRGGKWGEGRGKEARLGLTICGTLCGGRQGDVGARAELGMSVGSQVVGRMGKQRCRQRSALLRSGGES